MFQNGRWKDGKCIDLSTVCSEAEGASGGRLPSASSTLGGGGGEVVVPGERERGTFLSLSLSPWPAECFPPGETN